MKRVFVFGLILLILGLVGQGCAVLERLNVDDAKEFGQWVLANYNPSEDGWNSQGRLITLTKPDGTQLSREMPEDVTPAQLQQIIVGLRRSAETGSPLPAIFGVAGSALSILLGAFAKKKANEAKINEIRAVNRTRQLEAAVHGVEVANVDRDAKRRVANSVKDQALRRGVENGPDGLKAVVQGLAADVS